jgi:hypothetical protein
MAFGRKSFLHVGDENAGANIASLYSLVAACEANGKNPLAYLTDVLGRIGSESQCPSRRPPDAELETTGNDAAGNGQLPSVIPAARVSAS